MVAVRGGAVLGSTGEADQPATCLVATCGGVAGFCETAANTAITAEEVLALERGTWLVVERALALNTGSAY
jgi:hypothetical protein